ncbi:MAG TPA: helix-turn-helix transcriptional regulator [Pseudonocardiaceae bacterium]|jgi:DNA-binding PadR family transcriptional regulator|nr:helix-turn-helix transcriptional regulator [Pseudonocardiaceae bacterium]
MTGPIRITKPLLDVLEVLLRALADQEEPHGWAIMKATGRSGPTVYGVLERLEQDGWIEGRWDDRPTEPNKPRRRFDRLTPTGVTSARDLLAERRPQSRPAKPGRLRWGDA